MAQAVAAQLQAGGGGGAGGRKGVENAKKAMEKLGCVWRGQEQGQERKAGVDNCRYAYWLLPLPLA